MWAWLVPQWSALFRAKPGSLSHPPRPLSTVRGGGSAGDGGGKQDWSRKIDREKGRDQG